MKTILVPLIGDPVENLYQLGLKEREAFLEIEARIKKLLSTNNILSFGQDIVTRARAILRKRDGSLFDKCIDSYSKGLGIDPTRYHAFLSLFELAAHFGQVYPELKGILPGCTSVFSSHKDDITHTRLMDFPMIGIFDKYPRLYYWRPEGKEAILNYSCEGLAPLFFQGIHGVGISFAVHHKPGKSFYQEGQSIFQIMFDTAFETKSFTDFKKELKKKNTISKWSVLLLDKGGSVQIMDIDGPAQNTETYNVRETSPLIFTNIPIQNDGGFHSYLKFSEDRQVWIKEKLLRKSTNHILDLITDVKDQKTKNWIHPSATLSTVGAWTVNLSKGIIDIKEGDSALTAGDAILRLDLSAEGDLTVLKEKAVPTPFETAWKRAAKAQSAFDQGDYDIAYHELQMALAVMPHPVWKGIMQFYLCVWDFIFISNPKELAMVYKKLKSLEVPEFLKDQRTLLIMRMEKRLDLVPTVTFVSISPHYQGLFQQEKLANKPVFATWMKLIYPRMEILDIFSPHWK